MLKNQSKTRDFIYAISKIRVLENHFLSQSNLEKLVSHKSLDDLVADLRNFNLRIHNIYQFSHVELLKTLTLLEKLGAIELVQIFRLKYDCHNLKVLIKSYIFGLQRTNLLLTSGNIETDNIKRIINECHLNKIQYQSDFKKSVEEILNSTFHSTAKICLQSLSVLRDTQKIDLIVEDAMFNLMVKLAQKNDILVEMVRIMIDVYNIQFFVRTININVIFNDFLIGGYINVNLFNDVMKYDLPVIDQLDKILRNSRYHCIQNFVDIANIDKILDKLIVKVFQKYQYSDSETGNIVYYLLRKELDLKNIQIILVGKKNHISKDMILANLRMLD